MWFHSLLSNISHFTLAKKKMRSFVKGMTNCWKALNAEPRLGTSVAFLLACLFTGQWRDWAVGTCGRLRVMGCRGDTGGKVRLFANRGWANWARLGKGVEKSEKELKIWDYRHFPEEGKEIKIRMEMKNFV